MTHEKSRVCITLREATVGGLTVSGAILLDAGDQGYRIEVGLAGVERLAHLCDLILKDRSTRQASEERDLR